MEIRPREDWAHNWTRYEELKLPWEGLATWRIVPERTEPITGIVMRR